jgi:hypothetical protein
MLSMNVGVDTAVRLRVASNAVYGALEDSVERPDTGPERPRTLENPRA